jgi:hypothetical protein
MTGSPDLKLRSFDRTKLRRSFRQVQWDISGKVTDVVGTVIEARMAGAHLGNVVNIAVTGQDDVLAEVVGFRDDKALLLPYSTLAGMSPGSLVSLQLLLWMEAGAVAVVGGFIVLLPRRNAVMPCRKCGYELKGLEDENPRCPECGKEHAAFEPKVRAKPVASLPAATEATPVAPTGKASTDTALFDWIISDFGLNDAIESGLVKTPRVVVRDDALPDARTLRPKLYHIYRDPSVSEDLNRKDVLQAVLLADSFTQTIRPITHEQPKVLLPLCGVPMLDHALGRLVPQVAAVVINANGDPSRFAAYALPVVADGLPDHP